MELGYVLELVNVTDLQLEPTKPAFHESVLPRFAPATGRQLDLQLVAELLVPVAQVLAALVAVQDGWRMVLAERIQYGFVSQLATMSGAEPPADNLARSQVKHPGQVVPGMLELEVGETLHPSAASRHA